MNPQDRKKIIFAVVLVIVLIGVIVLQVMKGGTPPPKKPAATATSQAGSKSGAAKSPVKPTVTAAGKPAAPGAFFPGKSETTELKTTDKDIDQLLANVKEVDFDYDRERVPRDPMMKLIGKTFGAAEEKQDNTESLRNPTVIAYMKKVVSGIMWDDKKPLAIVDNEVVGSGYQYPDGGVVKSITRDQVVFQVGDSLIEVPLKEL